MLTHPVPIHAVAPLRISFVGGGTDFPHYFQEHGGAVLSSTIDHYVRVTIVPRDDRQVVVRSLDLDQLVEYHLDEGPVYDGVMDLAKAAIERIGVPGGIEMSIGSEAPAGSGLGGSSALVTAAVAGLAMLGDRALTGRGARPALLLDRAGRPAASAAAGRTSTRPPTAASTSSSSRRTASGSRRCAPIPTSCRGSNGT